MIISGRWQVEAPVNEDVGVFTIVAATARGLLFSVRGAGSWLASSVVKKICKHMRKGRRQERLCGFEGDAKCVTFL